MNMAKNATEEIYSQGREGGVLDSSARRRS